MGQVTIYLDDESERRLKSAAAAAGVPVSRWVAALIESKTRTEWPESVRQLVGAWGGFAGARGTARGEREGYRPGVALVLALDTNTLIYFFKGAGRVGERILTRAPSEIAIPAIVAYEIETGIAKSASPDKRRAQFEQLLEVVDVLPFDYTAASHSAYVRAALESAGEPIGPVDTLIAGTALAHNATLVTRNVGEFGRVPGLSVVDWFD